MLEWLHFIIAGCARESTQDNDRIVKMNQNGESLKEEGALAVVNYYYYYYLYYY